MARTMTVDVGDELREFIDSQVKAGDYRIQSEVMRDALRLLRDLLAEGISSGEAKTMEQGCIPEKRQCQGGK
ncbi:Predicted transcriptional regulators containing the CopG/Arc/MetJ DNA-binding domain [Citrobacter koseri]|uniref:Antitoxin ParD n=1 Tax=Citrobacter koseri TaxID=545 RepID=A0A3S4IWK4_CITKO|nr:Predicted transcriptional regulators containing the CopG/Arc/MetJ DNA-binding domain [Citrobacter koseri]